jgi:hypothetical protein
MYNLHVFQRATEKDAWQATEEEQRMDSGEKGTTSSARQTNQT